MKQKAINYEVLLFTGSHFSKKQFCKSNDNPFNNSFEDKLQKACWNGLIFQILPEITDYPLQKNENYVWEVIPAENFVDVKIGAAPYSVENGVSVNPYFFLSEKEFN